VSDPDELSEEAIKNLAAIFDVLIRMDLEEAEQDGD
jgi:hypothetical protein